MIKSNMKEIELNKKEQLIYDIIYEEERKRFKINLLDYIDDLKKVDVFSKEILSILAESGIDLVEQIFILTEEESSWLIIVDR